jgi:hypothetical protein
METVAEQRPGYVSLFGPRGESPGLHDELDAQPRAFLRSLAIALAVIATATVLFASLPGGFWGNSLSAQEGGNALLIRDGFFGGVVGAIEGSSVESIVSPDATLAVPGGSFYGPEGMRTIVNELDRVENSNSIMLINVEPTGDVVRARWTIEQPLASELLGFEKLENPGDYISGEMIFQVVNGQIVAMQMVTWPS